MTNIVPLYEIPADFEELSNPELELKVNEDYMERFREDATETILTLARIRANLQAEIDGIQPEIERLTKKADSRRRRLASVESYMQRLMESADLEKVTDRLFRIALRKNPWHVVIEDEELIPDSFKRASLTLPLPDLPEALRSKATVAANRSALLTAIKDDGEVVPGARIERANRLEVK